MRTAASPSVTPGSGREAVDIDALVNHPDSRAGNPARHEIVGRALANRLKVDVAVHAPEPSLSDPHASGERRRQLRECSRAKQVVHQAHDAGRTPPRACTAAPC